MLRRSAGQNTGPERGLASLIILASVSLTALALAVGAGNIVAKERARESDNTVALVADYDDLLSFQEGAGLAGSLDTLRLVPVRVILARATLPPADEKLIRDFGFSVLWRLEDDVPADLLLSRIKQGDSVVAAGRNPLDAPRYPQRLAEVLRRQMATLAVMEFSPTWPLGELPSLVPERLVRFHMITSREAAAGPRKSAWAQRVSRGANERWVRMACFRFSSAWTNEQNLKFFGTLALKLRQDGFIVGAPDPVTTWESPAHHLPMREWIALILAVLGPLAAVAALSQMKKPLPVPVFTFISLWSVVVGTAVHGLLASPMAAVGITPAWGIKAELVVPLAIGAVLLLTRAEIRTFLEKPIRWKDIVFGASAVAGLIAIYLMRSGNGPVIPVSSSEHRLRDLIEVFLGVRPRFKEFMFGHPLMIAGLNRFRRQRGGGFFKDGRAVLAVSMIGQISIINTFVHVQAPYEASLLRTFHGWWIGIILSIPLSWWLEWRFKRKPATA